MFGVHLCESVILRRKQGGRTLMRAPREVSLNLTHTGVRQSRRHLPKWSALDVDVKATSPTEEEGFHQCHA